MWFDNLKELKKKAGLTSKQIAEMTNLPERTVVRIFSGETNDPRIDTVRRIVSAVGGSLDDIFAESGAVIGDQNLAALQAEVERLTVELASVTTELLVIKNTNSALSAEADLLRLKLDHKEEIIAHKEKIISLYGQQEKICNASNS
jgi:transcriptional regulator with XRE-family HTH domain